jgi:hypothetical protein
VPYCFFILTANEQKREPIIIKSSPSYVEMTLDILINEADLIVIGGVETIFPGRWNTPDGKLPKGITVDTITPDKIIFTDDWLLEDLIAYIENLFQVNHWFLRNLCLYQQKRSCHALKHQFSQQIRQHPHHSFENNLNGSVRRHASRF